MERVMPANPSDADEKSLFRLLLELLWQLAVLIVPIVLFAMAPPLLSAGVAVLLVVLMSGAAKLGYSGAANALSRLLTAGMIGLGFGLGRVLPEYWNLAAAISTILFGLAGVSTLERRLGLAKAKPEAVDGGEPSGISAWGSGSIAFTPEGEPIHTFNWGEIAMGGPAYCDYLLPDGVVLEGLGSSALFSSDGRYFAAPVPSRDAWSLAIFDRQLRRLYQCPQCTEFWELDEFSETEIRGRNSPLVSNQGYKISLADLLSQAQSEDFIAIGDLWLAPSWADYLETSRLEFAAPQGSHVLIGELNLPDNLRSLDNPLTPLRYPSYRLQLDDQPSGLLLHGGETVVWREDGQALVCRARPQEETESSWSNDCWLWQQAQGWRALDEPWQARADEPSLNWGSPCRLDAQQVWREAYFDFAETDRLGYGYSLQSIHSDTEILLDHDALGRAVPGEHQLTRLQLATALDGSGTNELHLQPMQGQLTPCLSWLRDSQDGARGAYACHIGEWQLDGEWCVDHRVSDCGRYLALLAFADAPAVPQQVVIADVQTRSLLRLEQLFLVARFYDLRDKVLSFAHICGRLGEDEVSTPLRRFDHQAPNAASAAAFVAPVDGSRLYYQVAQVRIEADRLSLLPNWRLAEQAPAANAEGDFVLPAPDGRDAAWLFGAESSYQDNYLRERHPRQGGCLLTASGCAVADLAPSMIWSEDGRYLALTRYLERFDPRAGESQEDIWLLLLLDLDEKTLRSSRASIGLMPHFEGFDSQGLRVRTFAHDYQVAEDAGELRLIALNELLDLPAENLIASAGLWLPAEEQQRAGQWQRLDTRHLQAWNKGRGSQERGIL
jgi:hypothetical protein